ncbi:acyl-CoA dehydrogenase family protein [Vineibacter terrae]|uniref:acyl-CoA dehydrogenase family protein n=1 Tax=Vineibacter terrae TaxID=2586908 RepID=UPI002E31915A|nr:acyl-CoA dehydrogenase family protein [Vineibacter terrae]HEX2890940.1 acyl-CoA dehydrogenase family protein [Vineibacter terrae]
MNLDFSEEQKALKDQVRRFLDARCTPAAVRAVLEGPQPFDRALYEGLAALGVLGAAIPEEYGGVGLSHLELCVVAEELGRALAPVPAASSIYLAAEFLLQAGTEAQKRAWLPLLASGKAVATFAFAEGQGRMTPDKVQAVVADGRLSGVKSPVPDGDAADMAVVLARSGGSGAGALSLFVVDLAGPGVSRETLSTIDPTRSQARITFDGAPAEPLGGSGDGWHITTQVMDRAAILMAFEQVGGADRALEMARDYALDRMAFGRPIGSFQAIKHMLADMYVSATLARSNCYYAAWALASGAVELPVAAATARVSATTAFQHCAKNNIQVHGGMGFTWAFDCHLFYRRSNALALALGSLSTWESLLIERMSAGNINAAA